MPLKITQKPIPHSDLSYQLHFAGSWLFALYSPNAQKHQNSDVVLGRDTKTGYFFIAQYQPQTTTVPGFWKPITGFDYHMVHAYETDWANRLRILGWKDRNNQDELVVYLDMQFVREKDMKHFCWEHLDRNGALVYANSLLSRDMMIRTFRSVPAKPGSHDPTVMQHFPQHAYHPPRTRDYQPALARPGSPEPVCPSNGIPKHQQSFSPDNVPTLKRSFKNGSEVNGENGSRVNSRTEQHSHNHNASLGRIPDNLALNSSAPSLVLGSEKIELHGEKRKTAEDSVEARKKVRFDTPTKASPSPSTAPGSGQAGLVHTPSHAVVRVPGGGIQPSDGTQSSDDGIQPKGSLERSTTEELENETAMSPCVQTIVQDVGKPTNSSTTSTPVAVSQELDTSIREKGSLKRTATDELEKGITKKQRKDTTVREPVNTTNSLKITSSDVGAKELDTSNQDHGLATPSSTRAELSVQNMLRMLESRIARLEDENAHMRVELANLKRSTKLELDEHKILARGHDDNSALDRASSIR